MPRKKKKKKSLERPTIKSYIKLERVRKYIHLSTVRQIISINGDDLVLCLLSLEVDVQPG